MGFSDALVTNDLLGSVVESALYSSPRRQSTPQAVRVPPPVVPGLARRVFDLYRLFEDITMKTYMCVICGFVYDEEKGLPDEGIAPGTRWEDVPMNWKCPECGAGKEDFEMMEI